MPVPLQQDIYRFGDRVSARRGRCAVSQRPASETPKRAEGERAHEINRGRDENAPGVENVHDPRLFALLLDLVGSHGRTRVAEILGVSYHAVARAAASRRLTGRVSDVLARDLLEGGGGACVVIGWKPADRERGWG